MPNHELEKMIADIYGLKAVSIWPLSDLVVIILLSLLLLAILLIVLRKHYYQNRPWLVELKQIKNQLKQKTEIELNELSIYLKKIAKLKYHSNELNKMDFSRLINFISITENNSEFHDVFGEYKAQIYHNSNTYIKGSKYNAILRLIGKWI